MVAELVGGLFGGIFRLLPEIMSFFDKKNERKHELEMFDKQLEMDRIRGEQALKEIEAKSEAAMDIGGLQALVESIKSQGQITGVKWVDALNSLMRPLITFWWVIILQTVVLVAQFLALKTSGMTSTSAILSIWGSDEKAVVSSIMTFWFLDRVLRKRQEC